MGEVARKTSGSLCLLRVSDAALVALWRNRSYLALWRNRSYLALWRNRSYLALSEGGIREKDVVFSVS